MSKSRPRRLFIALAAEIPLVAVLVGLDAWIGVGLPTTAYVVCAIYIVVMVPWIADGRFPWAWRRG